VSDDQLIWAPSPAYHLVPTSFEAGLTERPLFDADGEVAVHVPEEVLFDLGAVGWIDVGALVQFVLIVDAVHRSGRSVSVALPYEADLRHPTPDLEPARSGSKGPRRKREDAASFLGAARFRQALVTGPFAGRSRSVLVVAGRDPSAPGATPGRALGPPALDGEDVYYQNLLPLTWAGDPQSGELADFASFSAGLITQEATSATPRGQLSTIEARDLSNVVIFEFVQNVLEHAGLGAALVMVWPRSIITPVIRAEVLVPERRFLTWLNGARLPTAEVVVGDNGAGLVRTLRESYVDARDDHGGEIVDDLVALWAFDRWSTSAERDPTRGTRGLYRVDRVAAKHAGLVSVRTGRSFVGKRHDRREDDTSFRHSEGLPDVPGTVVRLRLPPFHESDTRPAAPAAADFELPFVSVKLDPLGPYGLSEAAANRYFEVVRAHENRHVCLLVEISGGDGSRSAIKYAIRTLARLRHPTSVVVTGFNAPWTQVKEICDEISATVTRERQDAESKSRDFYGVMDPVLVLGPRISDWRWTGTSEAASAMLNELGRTEHGILSHARIQELVPDQDERRRALQALEVEKVAQVAPDGVRLALSVGRVVSGVMGLIQRAADAELSRRTQPGRVYLTPSLRYVRHWFDPQESVSTWCPPRFLALALASLISVPAGGDTIVVADGNANEVAGHLRTALGGSRVDLLPSEVSSEEPEGLHRYEAGASVVVLFDILASGQSARRAIGQARRDGAFPIALLTVLDARERDTSRPRSFGVDEYCLASIDIDADPVPDPRPIDPFTRPAPVPSEREFRYALSEGELDALVRESGALQLGHWGSAGGRHFTFYLDATALLRQPSLLRGVVELVEGWSQPERMPTLELWHPEPEQRLAAPGRTLAEHLRTVRPDASVRPVHRRGSRAVRPANGASGGSDRPDEVVILDWGAITGSTVFSMLREAVDAGAKRVLVCLLLNQLPAANAALLARLRTLEAPFDDAEDGPATDVQVSFLAPFPVVGYESNCPVCQRLARLPADTSRLPDLIHHEQQEVKQLLALRPREDVASVDDVLRTADHQDRLLDSLRLRSTLQATLQSTVDRRDFVDRLKRLVADVGATDQSRASESLSDALTLVQFLSAEPQWITKPPLVFDEAAEHLAELARLVAIHGLPQARERADAIVVLRMASQEAFVAALASIFEASGHDEVMLGALFHGAYSLVGRDYIDRDSIGPLADAMETIKRKMDANPKGALHDVRLAADRINGMARMQAQRAEVVDLTRPEAWQRLVGVLVGVPPHRTEALEWMSPSMRSYEVSLVQSGLVHDPGLVYSWSDNLLKHWSQGSWEFMNVARPLLSLLAQEMAGRDAEWALSETSQYNLLDLIGSTDAEHSRFGEFVAEIARRRADILQPATWNRYVSRYRDVVKELMIPQLEGTDPETDEDVSSLVRFLRSVPANISVEVAEAIGEYEAFMDFQLVDIPDTPVWAFAPVPLVREVVRTFFDNIRIRTDPTGERAVVHVQIRRIGDHVELRVGNTATNREDSRRRRAIRALKDRAHAFGGAIEDELQVMPPFTFAVAARFLIMPNHPPEEPKERQ
jgi:hypothetical protein